MNTRVFSLCFAQSGGRLIVGGYNSSYHLDPAQPIPWFALGQPTHFYVVSLENLRVNGQTLNLGGGALKKSDFGRTILDSGTTYTYFPQKIYAALLAALASACGISETCGTVQGNKQDCWDWSPSLSSSGNRNGGGNGSSASTTAGTTIANGGALVGSEAWLQALDTAFPVLHLVVSGHDVRWRPRSYLQRQSSNKLCYGFDQDPHDTVLGSSFFIDHEVIFDIENGRVGIVDANCPNYDFAKRPRGPLSCDFKDSGGASCPPHETGNPRTDSSSSPQGGAAAGGGGFAGGGGAAVPASRNFVPEEDVSAGSRLVMSAAAAVVALVSGVGLLCAGLGLWW